jgi:APA family basic amino acid/polyamine antiporter
MVVVAVVGSLAAVLLGSPRVYMAMARDGVFPERLARFNAGRGTVPASTIAQVTLACALVLLGTFNDILGYFVPCAVFFLGLAAAAVLMLPRPDARADVFRTPLHPLPVVLFLVMVVSILGLFVAGQPRQTLLGALVVALGIPVSQVVLSRRPR